MRNDFCSNYLEHSAKGTTWKDTKYLKKIPMGNGQYYYIYTQEQLNAYNKKFASSGGSTNVTNVLSNEKKQEIMSSGKSIEELARTGYSIPGNTTQEKAANMQKAISDGEKTIQETLSKESSTKSGKKSGSGSSSSKSGSGSKKSKSSSGSKSKGSSGGASKEKSSASGKGSSSKAKSTTKTNKLTNKNNRLEEKTTMESLMKSNGKKEKDTETHNMSASDFKKKMLSKYKEGSFGYLSSGNKVYKWTIANGQLVLQNADTGKQLSFDYYLKDANSFKEFEADKNKKK